VAYFRQISVIHQFGPVDQLVVGQLLPLIAAVPEEAHVRSRSLEYRFRSHQQKYVEATPVAVAVEQWQYSSGCNRQDQQRCHGPAQKALQIH